MSTSSNQPGGGFSEVKGYNPPAGTQADEQRRQREADEQRRRNDEAMQRSADLANQQREWQRDRERQQESNAQRPRQAPAPKLDAKPQPPRRGGIFTKPAPAQSPRTPSRPLITPGPWNPLFGIAGFLGVTAWAASKLNGENKLILAAVAGLFAGFVIGKLWKQLLWVGVIGGGVWLWSRSRQPNAGVSFQTPTPSSPASTWNPTPSPLVNDAPTPPSLAPSSAIEDPSAPQPAPAAAPPPPTDFESQPLAGFLFLHGDVTFQSVDVPGLSPMLVMTHTPHLDHARVRWIEYFGATRQIVVVMTGHTGDLERYDLGVPLPPEFQDARHFALDVKLISSTAGEPPSQIVRPMYILSPPSTGETR